MANTYLWFDAEFTSTDLDRACFLQVACMATDSGLRRLVAPDEDINLAVALPAEAELSPWVLENIPEIVAASRAPEAVPVEEVDARLEAYLRHAVGPPAESIGDRPIIAGNSVHNDWCLARRLLPRFVAGCHYRILDVTSLKTQWLDHYGGEELDKEDAGTLRRWFPQLHLPERSRTHDAYYDVQASAAELAYLRAGLTRV